MVVKKIICVIGILILCVSCYIGKKTIYGLPRKKISIPKGDISIISVDTNALYKMVINFRYDKLLNNYSYHQKVDDHYYPYVSYLKFYNDGKLGLFIIPKKDTAKLEGTEKVSL